MRYQCFRPDGKPICCLASIVSCAIIIVSLTSGHSLHAQGTLPLDPNRAPSIWNPVGTPGSDAQAINSKISNDSQSEQDHQASLEESVSDDQDELQVQAPALSSINQSTLSVEAESKKNSVSSGALEVSGGYIDNLYDRPLNKIGSGFSRYSFPLNFSSSAPRLRFQASYVPQITSYSEATGIYQSHTYGHTLLYGLNARTTISWQLTGARYHDVGQFLPVVLPIGGTGIAQPTGAGSSIAGNSTVSNAATSVALLRHLSIRDEITFTGTAAWNELLQTNLGPQIIAGGLQRNQSFAANILYEHSISNSTFIGIEETTAYLRGLSTSTSLLYETVLGTLRHALGANDSLSLSAGPLMRISSSGPISSQDNGVTYEINARYTHQSRIATISGSYERVLQLSLDNTATPAHLLSGTFIRPITGRLDLTTDLRFISSGSSVPKIHGTSFGGGLRLNYRTGSRLSWFANASQNYSSQPAIGTSSLNFSRSELSGGVRIALNKTPSR